MATTEIPWGDGSTDKIYLTYPSASGDQTVVVTSDANTGAARSKVVNFSTMPGNVTQILTINQERSVPAESFVEYLSNDSLAAYIDTTILSSNKIRLVIEASHLSRACSFFVGARRALRNSMFALGPTASSANYFRSDLGNAPGENSNLYMGTTKFKFELNAQTKQFLVDDALVRTCSNNTIGSRYNIHIFGMNQAGTHQDCGATLRVYSCKIYDDGVLVRDLVPYRVGQVGYMYDKANDVLLGNAGTGSFGYGNDVTQ